MPFTLLDRSIKGTFFLTIAGILLLGTIALSATIAVNEGRSQHNILKNKGSSFAGYMAKLSVDPLIMRDSIQLDSIVKEVGQDDEILYAVIQDSSGAIVTSQFASINYASSRIRELKSRFGKADDLSKILDRIHDAEATVKTSAPIVTGGETIGRVVVCLSKHNILHDVLVTVSVVILLNIVVALLLAASLVQVSRRIVFRPIADLAKAAQRLAAGDLSTRIPSPASSEMGMLTESFNQMAADLQKTTVSREYMDNIIRSMTESLVIVAPDLTIRDVNPATTALSGYSREELLGQPASLIMDLAPLQELLAAPCERSGSGAETWCRTRQGRETPIHLAASAMRRGDGSLEGIVCNVLDISALRQVTRQLEAANESLTREVQERKRAQEEAASLNADLEQQKLALEAANQELESFCYSVSHDLRAPLRHINGFAGMLREDYHDRLDRQGQNFIERLCGASTHMGNLIDGLLSFSRVSRTEMRQSEVDLSAGAARVAAMLRELEPGREVEVDITPGLAARGDETLLQMVLQNLIGNAWKYTARSPSPRIQVGRTTVRGQEAFFVRDNGIGFDMTYSHKLFRVFERLHGEEFEGTGIGLATVQRIILRHGGEIWAEGETGTGATFYFTLPPA
jgi:PAS domain S-box-containing protein